MLVPFEERPVYGHISELAVSGQMVFMNIVVLVVPVAYVFFRACSGVYVSVWIICDAILVHGTVATDEGQQVCVAPEPFTVRSEVPK